MQRLRQHIEIRCFISFESNLRSKPSSVIRIHADFRKTRMFWCVYILMARPDAPARASPSSNLMLRMQQKTQSSLLMCDKARRRQGRSPRQHVESMYTIERHGSIHAELPMFLTPTKPAMLQDCDIQSCLEMSRHSAFRHVVPS